MNNTKTTPGYWSWISARQRCRNPKIKNFKNYGGRGITVCERWDSFANFLADMGPCPPGLTLERVNNALGYSPENCKWATRKEQYLNKRSHAWNRLTPDQVRAIRIDPRRPYRIIAADYGVTRHMIGMIIRGDCWEGV